MTADRRADRRFTRVHHASPYSQKTRNAKPSQHSKKSSGWSLTGFLKYFNPLRLRRPQEPEEETEEGTSRDEPDTNHSSQTSDDVFGSRTQPTQPPPPPVVRPPDLLPNDANPPANPSILQFPPLPESSASPLKNVDAVKTYLEQNGGRPLHQVEIAGLVSMLQDSIDNIDDDNQQPFRFSKSPSRADTPATNSFSSSTISPSTTATPKTPNRTLSKNPNGTYKWQGAGSARPNRYHSPAFGSPSSGNKIKLQPAETPKSNLKRRRVGQDAEFSSPQKTSTSRQSSTEPTTAGPDVKDTAADRPPQSKPQLNGINTSRLSKGTTPVVSSPLRQAWGQDDFPSPNSSPTSAPKPSRAAAFMTELIREATPPKKPDIANPYQTASPVKIVKPSTKRPVRKPRPVSKPSPTEEKERKQPELTMQAIIEATLPKGSKRSRPPAHLSISPDGSSEASSVRSPSQSPSPPPRRSPFPSFQNGSSTTLDESKMVTVEEVEDEDDPRLPKRQKNTPTPAEPMIVEIEDPLSPSQTPLRPSEVIEPGDVLHLQTAGLNGTTSSPAPAISPTTTGRSFFGLKSSAPKEPSKLRFSIKADRDETTSSASSVSPTAATFPKDAKSEVLSMATPDLPDVTFTLSGRTIRGVRSSGELRAEKEVRGFADDDIPMDGGWKLSSTSAGPSNLNKTTFPISNSTITPSTANGGFNWGAAGLKPPKQEDGWKCGTCDLMNTASAIEKCTVCDAPKPGAEKTSAALSSVSKPLPTSFVFDSGSTSTTTMTTTTNPINSSPRGFNWGAAGLKPPMSNTDGWKCGTCDLMNPASAKEKCTVCDAPKPGISSSTGLKNVFSVPTPPSGPLLFGASNLTSSTSTTSSAFSFGVPKPAGSAFNPSFTGFGSTPSIMTTITSNGTSEGFDWSAAGLKRSSDKGGWKCTICELTNPESAKEKCMICDSPKL